jgi:glycosyltransferase 2 family protein
MKYLKTFLKSAFILGLLYFLIQRGFISWKETQKALDRWPNVLTGCLLLAMTNVLGAVRWQWLLAAQGIRLPGKRTLELTLVGNFFNIALPGAVSGDFVKAFYIGKELPGKRARAFGSILFDRFAGLGALVLVAALAMLSLSMMDAGQIQGISIQTFVTLRPLIIICILTEIFFFCYLFVVREHRDPILMLCRRLEKIHPKLQAVTRIYEGLRHYHHHKLAVFKVILISIFIHVCVGVALLQFAAALGADHLPILGVYTVFPLGLLITAVPIAPAGVGTGHMAFLYLFNLVGSARGADIYTLFALTNIAYGAIGGIVYLRFRSQEPPTHLDAKLPEPLAADS